MARAAVFAACVALSCVWEPRPWAAAQPPLASDRRPLPRQAWSGSTSGLLHSTVKSNSISIVSHEGTNKINRKSEFFSGIGSISTLSNLPSTANFKDEKDKGIDVFLQSLNSTFLRNKRQTHEETQPFLNGAAREPSSSPEESQDEPARNSAQEKFDEEMVEAGAAVVAFGGGSPVNSTDQQLCRSWQTMLPRELYVLDASAHCLDTITRGRHNWTLETVATEAGGTSYPVTALVARGDGSATPVYANVSAPELRRSFSTPRGLDRWEACVAAASACCTEMLSDPHAAEAELHCPRTWDRLQCWSDTAPDTVVSRPCPSYFHADPPCGQSDAAAHKRCLESGSWYRSDHGFEWTNYTECNIVAEHMLLRMRWHIAVCSLSVAALLPALIIFFSYRQLQVRRITLHKHLFLSLILEAVFNIWLRCLQLYSLHIIQESPWWCILISVCLKYLRQSNYMWFFNEGFYLHRLLASAFTEQRNFCLFYCLGWALPVVPVAAYLLARALYFKSASGCIIMPQDGLEWVLMLLPFAAIITNVIFFINIIRILLIKLKATSDARNDIRQYKTMARATVMVVPLFGLQFLLTIYRPGPSACRWITYYHVLNHVIEGSTGALVAVIFCYMNGEVRSLLRRSCRSLAEELEQRGFPRLRENIQLKSRYSVSTVHTLLPDTQLDTSVARARASSPPGPATASPVAAQRQLLDNTAEISAESITRPAPDSVHEEAAEEICFDTR